MRVKGYKRGEKEENCNLNLETKETFYEQHTERVCFKSMFSCSDLIRSTWNLRGIDKIPFLFQTTVQVHLLHSPLHREVPLFPF